MNAHCNREERQQNLLDQDDSTKLLFDQDDTPVLSELAPMHLNQMQRQLQ